MLPESMDSVDRLSTLPDAILGVILSFLLTTEAVATSVLSKRWKFLWVSVPSLDFQFYDNRRLKVSKKEDLLKFVDFVNHVLHLHSCRMLDKFNFVWFPRLITSSNVDTWINTALTKNVGELSMRCVGPDGPSKFDSDFDLLCFHGSYEFPVNVLCCNSLHSLVLVGCMIDVSENTVISLPKVEFLKMSPVTFVSKNACEIILSGCPVLKFLHLKIIICTDFECVISSDTLVSLKLFFKGECRFKLRKAPALEYLMLDGVVCEVFVDASLDSLVEAHFIVNLYHFNNNYGSRKSNSSIVEAVRAFERAKVLALTFEVLQALAKARIRLSTKFNRLVKLEAGTCSSVIDFIYNADNLQTLIIQKDGEDPDRCFFDYDRKKNHFVEVPRCISNSLKEFRIVYYAYLDVENEMIRYILRHGSVLELLEITYIEDFYGDGKSEYHQNKLLQKICALPKKSPVCQVRVISS